MKAFAVALVVCVACVAGAGPGAAAVTQVEPVAIGHKEFLQDCTLTMTGWADGPPAFVVNDDGTECDQYQIRGASIVTTAGRYAFSGFDSFASPTHENFAVRTDVDQDGFAYGTVDVYIPYRSRCDRYRLYASNAVRHLDSRPCFGESYLNRLVDGPVTGRGTTDSNHPGCDGNFVTFDTIYSAGEPPAQSGTGQADVCVVFGPLPFAVHGTFALTSGTGATLRGTIEGTATPTEFHNVLTVTSGTGQFRYATGTIDLTGVATGSTFEGNNVGSLVEAHLRVNDNSVTEGDTGQSRMVFRVRLSAARAVPVTVRFEIADGSASSRSDYVFKQGTLTFAPGETTKTVGVKVNGDTRTERNETLSLKLFNSPNARITVPTGTGTILNDD